jgi:DNA polymerase-3 subunit epsilon
VEVVGWLAARDVTAGTAAPPSGPGVYAFEDAAGRLMYVGSSRDLARRVPSYFAGHWPRGGKEARLARLVARVGWRRAGSHLEALVDEARAIARHRPYFNRRLKTPDRHVFVRFDPRDAFPRLEVVRDAEPGAWRHLGPFPAGRRLAAALDAIADALGLRTCAGPIDPDPGGRACLRRDLGQCLAPCVAETSAGAYGRRLVRAIALLGGGDASAARRLGAPTNRSEVRPGGALAGALAALRTRRLASRVVVVVPAAVGVGHRLVGVHGGRLALGVAAPDARGLADAFRRVAAALAPPSEALLPATALDEVRVVTSWLARREGRAAAVDLDRLGRDAAWRAVVARAGIGPLFAATAIRSDDRRDPA